MSPRSPASGAGEGVMGNMGPNPEEVLERPPISEVLTGKKWVSTHTPPSVESLAKLKCRRT